MHTDTTPTTAPMTVDYIIADTPFGRVESEDLDEVLDGLAGLGETNHSVQVQVWADGSDEPVIATYITDETELAGLVGR